MIGRRGFLGGLLALVAAPTALKALPSTSAPAVAPVVAPAIDAFAPTSGAWAAELMRVYSRENLFEPLERTNSPLWAEGQTFKIKLNAPKRKRRKR